MITRYARALLLQSTWTYALAAAFIPATALAEEKPNILWLTSEDHGPHMGSYGDSNARTPNVDALAAKGMFFTRVWSCAPVCAPARTAIISGMYPSSTGALHMRSLVAMPAGAEMFPQLLRSAGYYCTNNSKEDYNLKKPGQVWDESSHRAHWKRRGAGQPFFAVFNSGMSHESQIRTRPHKQITDPQSVRVPAYHPDTPEVRQDWAQYYDKVSEADADAGARLQELKDAGLDDDTIVFYYADHGSGMPRSKRWPSNSGLHVPLVVYFPEKWRRLAPKEYAPGGKSDRLVNFVDLAPTVLSLAGLPAPESMQGQAFAGPQQSEPPRYLFGERGRMDERVDVVRSATDGRYVYLRNYLPHVSQGQHVTYQFETPTTRIWRKLYNEGRTNEAQSIFWKTPKAPEELYDLATDPDEVQSLAQSRAHQDVLMQLRAAQRQHARRIRDVCFLPEGEMHLRSKRSSPYDVGRSDERYPFERIVSAAELASNLDAESTPQLLALLGDSDSGVRYWAAMGFLMRGASGIEAGKTALRTALADESPDVRIVAAEALGRFGDAADLKKALAVLAEFAPPQNNGFYASAAALGTIDALGAKAAPLFDVVRAVDASNSLPDERMKNIVPRLVAHITK